MTDHDMRRRTPSFHAMEDFLPILPRYGRFSSTLWKISVVFSTLWKIFRQFFHAMEDFLPHRGKLRLLFPRYGTLALVGCCLAWVTGCASIRISRLGIPPPEAWQITASASVAEYGPEHVLDGQTNTWWRSGTGLPQWIEVDVGRVAMVCGVSLQWGRPHAVDFAVLTSLDGEQWAVGFETTEGDGGWDQILIDPIQARQIRILVKGGAGREGVALCGLEILGPDQRPEATVDGIAAPVAGILMDGNPATVWRSLRSNAILELDLRRESSIGSLRLDWGTNGFASNVVVEVSTNRSDWMGIGQIRSQGGDFDVLMLDEALTARYLRLAFGGGSSPDGFEVAGVTLRGSEGVAQPWALMELAASQAPDGIYPDVLRRRRAHWVAALGPSPGGAEGLLDEWGTFAPDGRSPTLSPLVIADGEVWSAHQAQTVEHRLAADGVPLPETTWRLPSGLALRIRAMPWPESRPPVTALEYELHNDSLMVQTGRLVWVVRPVRLPPRWAGGGLAPIFRLRQVATAANWQELWVDAQRLYAVPDPALPFGCVAFDRGDVVECFLHGKEPSSPSVRDTEGLASAAWWRDFDLSPGERMRMVVAASAPLEGRSRKRGLLWPDMAGGVDNLAAVFDRHWDEMAWAWREKTAGFAPKIARPDAIECLHAQVAWLLGLQTSVNGGSGERMESIALKVAALLRAGQTTAAREWIERVAAGMATDGWVPAIIRADGSPAPRLEAEGEFGSQGQLAFMVMEYYRFTRDLGFLQTYYPAVRNSLTWVQRLRGSLEKTEVNLPSDQRELLEGLLPLSPARPGYPRPGHVYADYYWTLLGWKELRSAATLLGKVDDALWADGYYGVFKAAVARSLRTHLERRETAWLPAVAEEERVDAASIALLFWPCDETDLVEPHELQSSLDQIYAHFLERGGVARDPAAEAHLLMPLAAVGRGDYAREILYALLATRRPTNWHAWPTFLSGESRPSGAAAGFMPNIRAAAAYVLGVRGLAARETGRHLDLFSGAPAEWLQHGEGFRVYGMPTAFGPLDLHGRWHLDHFNVEIAGGARPPEGYRLWWPRHGLPTRVLANGSHLTDYDAQGINLPHDFKGTVEAVFPFNAPWPRDP